LLCGAGSLAQLDTGATASAAQLAERFGVLPACLATQLRALVRAGVLTESTGQRGGIGLARRPDEITLLQIVEPSTAGRGST
jgi:DNA-binding IscR family transcriptional regulator